MQTTKFSEINIILIEHYVNWGAIGGQLAYIGIASWDWEGIKEGI